MDVYTIDFETYYSKTYSLTKLTTQQYIDDPQFEVIGVAVKKNQEPTVWFSGTAVETEEFLAQFDFESTAVVAHNALFDASILSWSFGIKPKLIIDTLSMARAVHGTEVGNSLAKLAAYYELGVKGTEVVNALGKRRVDFNTEELDAYAGYCINDVELTYELFRRLASHFNKTEINLIDMTVRMHSEPSLVLDIQTLDDHLIAVRDRKQHLLQQCAVSRADLMSNPKFAAWLRKFGVNPPMKISARTGKETYAFAKTDEGMKALAEHPNPDVQTLVAARLGTKSTLEETRTERFINIAQVAGVLPVPLKYYGAMTGRWAATDKINLQNLPRGSVMKKAIQAPEGYVIVGADLSNIELRVGLYFAGQWDKLKLLREGVDLYKDFASPVFNVAYDDISEEQRFIGKTCIAEGTLVLSGAGWKPIEQVSVDDKLWDGEEWVCHQGLQSNGYKETLSLCGSWLTPDHLVWSGTQWLEAQSVVSDSSILSRVLGIGAANLPLQATYKAPVEESHPSSSNATAGALNTLWTSITSRISEAHDVINALGKRGRLNATGPMPKQCQMTSIGGDCSIGWQRRSVVATSAMTPTTRTMEGGAFTYTQLGAMTKRSFLGTCKHLLDGIRQSSIWIESTITAVTNREISGSYPERRTPETNVNAVSLRRKLPVYDLLCAGPKNRFTILTNSGPLIVHNCQLSLIYGTGAVKLRNAIKADARFGTDIGEEKAKEIVDRYRTDYENVKRAWYAGDRVIKAMKSNAVQLYEPNERLALIVDGENGIKLPSGLMIQYPDLSGAQDGDRGGWIWTYKQRNERVKIYGPKVFQNVVQALARCVMGEAMVRIHKRYPVVLTIHDACYSVVPEQEAEEARRFIITELRKAPTWAEGIPLDAEGGFGKDLSFKMSKL